MKLISLILVLLSLQPFALKAEDFLKDKSIFYYLSHKYTFHVADKKEMRKKKHNCERVEITMWQLDEVKNLRIWHKQKNPRVKILEETADKLEVFGQKTKNESKIALEFKGLYATKEICKSAIVPINKKFDNFIKKEKI